MTTAPPLLPLTPRARPCVRCGFCCAQAPCPFGTPGPGGRCLHLTGDAPGAHACSIINSIVQQPPWRWRAAPAFGAGCCSPLNNQRRGLQARRTA